MTFGPARHDNGDVVTLCALTIALADPFLLEIGTSGRVTVAPGLTDTATGTAVTVKDVAKAAEGVRFVFVGESHDSPDHHRLQADVVEALVATGRPVSVGFEMFTRDNQAKLLPWAQMPPGEAAFLEQIDWKGQWGMPFRLYRPIFQVARWHSLPLVALNIPRAWVRQVSRQGPETLTDEQKAWIPRLDVGNKDHRSVFDALIGGHPLEGPQMDRMYAAQCAWDEAMADAALSWLKEHGRPNEVMVVIAGSGHVMYGQGINWRVTKTTGEKTLSVVCIDAEGPREVSKGLAEFVFSAPAPPR